MFTTRAWVFGLMLLLSMDAMADARERYVRPVPESTLRIQLLMDIEAASARIFCHSHQQCQQQLPAALLHTLCGLFCDSPLDYFRVIQAIAEDAARQVSADIVLEIADIQDSLTPHADIACTLYPVVMLILPDSPDTDYLPLLTSLRQRGLPVSLLSEQADWQGKQWHAAFSSDEHWLPLSDNGRWLQLHLYRYVLMQYNMRKKIAMPGRIQHVSVAKDDVVISYLWPARQPRWSSELLHFTVKDDVISDAQGNAVFRPDGTFKKPLAEYRGINQRLRQQNNRRLYLDNGNPLQAPSDNNAWLALFQLSAADTQQLSAYTKESRNIADLLFDSLHGLDLNGEQRRHTLAGIVHSKPLLLNYGLLQYGNEQWPSPDNPYRLLLAATGEGRLHGFDIQAADGYSDENPERFSIMPTGFLPGQAPLLLNTHKHAAYGMDGALAAVMLDRRSQAGNRYQTIDHPQTGNCLHCDDKVWLYAALGRGGKRILHYDLSNPFQPRYLGSISKTAGGDFDELELSFSRPVPLMVQFNDKPVAALLFGSGYHGLYDNNGNAAAISMPKETSSAVYLVKADDRSLIWKAVFGGGQSATNRVFRHPAMRYAIPSAFSVVNHKDHGMSDKAYAGDVAGQVWRIELPACREAQCQDPDYRQKYWKVHRLAVLSDAQTDNDRRFFHAPAVWRNGDDHYIAMASGNHELPLETQVKNYLYILRDREAATITSSDLSHCDTQRCPASPNGWQLPLDFGEKPQSAPVFDGSHLLLSTFQPQRLQCGAEPDIQRLYRLRLSSTEANHIAKTTLPPDSLLAAVDDTNIAVLKPMIDRYFQQHGEHHDADSKDDSELGTGTGGGGIVMTDWRVEHNQ